MDNTQLTEKIISFVRSIGLPVRTETIEANTFLPGILIDKGGIVIDVNKLLYPGDILHEAGHLAVALPSERASLNGDLATGGDDDLGPEMMAMAWSYAACKHLDIDPLIVFHPHGYQGSGADIAKNFDEGRYVAVCTLQWAGMCYEPGKDKPTNDIAYPRMLKWLREA